MKLSGCLSQLLAASTLSTGLVATEPVRVEPKSPPPVEPPVIGEAEPEAKGGGIRISSNVYSIGDPLPEEQLYLEMINRARANPAAEGQIFAATTDPSVVGAYEFFSVDLSLMMSQFAAIPPAPPLTLNAKLNQAARKHSEDMFHSVKQTHVSSDGRTLVDRVRAEGYRFSRLGENVFSYGESVFHGHAGFEVDWGFGEGGMQNPPGHRLNIHEPLYREVGIGMFFGRKTSEEDPIGVGPQLVTQNFGTEFDGTDTRGRPFITGVVYFDLNGNSFYDVGEGIGGITVNVTGTTNRGVTARSGGYAVPVSTNGTYTVTFEGSGLAPITNTVVIQNRANVKIDFTPVYTAPVVIGTANPALNAQNTYSISPVGGASVYGWRRFQLIPASLEGAENGTNNVIISASEGYNLIDTSVKKSGTASFHLVHPQPRSQTIQINRSYLVSTNSAITFQSRLVKAMPDQKAKVQISLDTGATWQSVYTQAGAGEGSPGESIFNLRTVDLSPFAGHTVMIRFNYEFISGQLFQETSSRFGWFIDDIQVQADELTDQVTAEVVSPSFQFKPTALATFGIQARAKTGHDFLPWGPITFVEAVRVPPAMRFISSALTADRVQFEFEVISGTPPASFGLESRTALEGTATTEAVAVEKVSENRFRLSVPRQEGTTKFLRVVANSES